jgi:hypothetical protein
MRSVLISAFLTFQGLIRSRIALHLEVLVLHHQLQAGAAAITPAPPRSRKGRPMPLGLVVAGLGELAHGARHRSTGDRHRVASPRLPLVLGVEQSATHGQIHGAG